MNKNHVIKLMTHLVIGYPTIKDTVVLAKTMEQAGADYLELQIPFSDPIADGSTIMRACEKALGQGLTVDQALTCVVEVGRMVTIPRYIMAYYNTIFKFGVKNFCKVAKEAGVSGLIIPDMPLDEEKNEHLFRYCSQYILENIRVVSSASTTERLKKNAKVATGFIYATAQQGTTGARNSLREDVKEFLKRVKKCITLPLAVGFGISKPEHVRSFIGTADIAIVGSAIIDVINRSDKNKMLENVINFIRSLKMIE